MNRTQLIASVPPEEEDRFLAFFERHCDQQNRIELPALVDRALESDDARYVSDVIAHLCLLPGDAELAPLVTRGLSWSKPDPWNGVLKASLAAVPHIIEDIKAIRPRLETLCFHEDMSVRDFAIAILEADEETDEDRQLAIWRELIKKDIRVWPGAFVCFRPPRLGRKHTNTMFAGREENFRKKTDHE